MKLASLADDARLETDRLLVVVDRERAEVFARDDLFRGAVLLADRDLDVSLDVDLLHLDRLLRNLEIHGRGLVGVHLDGLLDRGVADASHGQGVVTDRHLHDGEFAFRVGHASKLGSLDENVRVRHPDSTFIRDLSRDRAGLRLGGRYGGSNERGAEEERDDEGEDRQVLATSKMARHMRNRSFPGRGCHRKPAILMPFLGARVKAIHCNMPACRVLGCCLGEVRMCQVLLTAGDLMRRNDDLRGGEGQSPRGAAVSRRSGPHYT